MKATSHIFLSYAREDEKKVENLYQELSDAGFNPWMDKKDILPGEIWKSSIQTAIRRSDFFLACLSANSINKRGFLQKEIRDALDIWQEKLESDIYLIPIRLEDCEVPGNLRDFQWLNMFEEDGWTQLLKAIQVGMERRGEANKSVVRESTPFKPYPAREKPSPGLEIAPPEEGSERVPTDLKDLLHGGLARDEVKPPVMPRVQVLPFNQLSWENFERLCTRLVASEGDVVDCHRYGRRGDFQAGIDILAHRHTAEGTLERWCYQCKRWQKMTPGDLRQIVEKFDFNNTDRYVVMVSLEASAGLRDVVADRPEVDLWDAEDISGQLKRKPGLVEDFFSPAWRAAFCTMASGKRKRLRTPNPFTDVVAIRDPDRFVGREPLLERLLRVLKGGSVALVGERKIGKSSLLHWLADLLRREPGQAVVFWDFFDPVDVTQLWARATRELDSDGETWEDFKRAVHSRRVVLLLDEFDVAPERGFDLDVLRGCRALCQVERGLRLVTASRTLPKGIFPKPGAGSWPYDFLGIQPLGPLTEGESHRLLAHPWAPDALHFDTPVCEELIALSGRHPYRLQRAAHHRYETLCDPAYDWRAGYELDLEALQ